MAERRTHLLDPQFTEFDRTYCGLTGRPVDAPATDEQDLATCKTCLRARRILDREQRARELARRLRA